MLGVVIIAACLARWNLTLVALVVSWTLAQFSWLVTGDNSPETLYVILDGIVLGLIYAKQANRGRLLPASWGDRIVVLVFPAAWVFYALPDSRSRWFALYYLAIAQFLAAGADSVACLLKRGRTRSNTPPPGLYRMAWAHGRRT